MIEVKKSSLQLEIPSPFRERILEYGKTINPKWVMKLEGRPHIVVAEGIETDDAEEVAAAICPFLPIRVMLGAVKMFMATESRPTDTLFIQVFSETIRRLRRKIKATKPFIEYGPYIEVAYMKEYSAMQYVGSGNLIESKFVVDRLTFYSSQGEASVITNRGDILCQNMKSLAM